MKASSKAQPLREPTSRASAQSACRGLGNAQTLSLLRSGRELRLFRKPRVGATDAPEERAADRAGDLAVARRGVRATCGSCSGAACAEASGVSLAGIRLHTDAAASQAATALDARAFTIGHHIFFGAGEFKPQTSEGLHLLAHEVEHTKQAGREHAIRRQTYSDGGAIAGTGGTDASVSEDATVQAGAAADSAVQSGTGALLAAASAVADDPCLVAVRPLTNARLVALYIRTNAVRRDADRYYDHRRLLGRLVNERHRRSDLGHAWLGDSVSSVPSSLYRPALVGGRMAVSRVAGDTVAASTGRISGPVMTEAQLRLVLGLYGFTGVDLESHFVGTGDAPLSFDLEAAAREMAAETNWRAFLLPPSPRDALGLTPGRMNGFGPMAFSPTPTAADSMDAFLARAWQERMAIGSAPTDDQLYTLYSRRSAPIPIVDPTAFDAAAAALSTDVKPGFQVGGEIIPGADATPAQKAGAAFIHYSPGADADIHYRVYVNANPEHAIELMRTLIRQVVEPNASETPANKIAAARIMTRRRDNVLLTASSMKSVERILNAIRVLQRSNPAWFMPETVPMTDPILPGVGIAAEPKDHSSFGTARTEQIAQAFKEMGPKEGLPALRARVARILRAAGVDPANPHASRDLITLGSERRAVLQSGSSVRAYHAGGFRSPAVTGTALGGAMSGALTLADILRHPERHPHAIGELGLSTTLGMGTSYVSGGAQFAWNARVAPLNYTFANSGVRTALGRSVLPRAAGGALTGGPAAVAMTWARMGLGSALWNEDYNRWDYGAMGARTGVSGTVAGLGGAGAAALTGAIAGSEVPILGNIVGAGIGLLLYWGSDALFGERIERSVRSLEPGGCEGIADPG